MEQLKNKINTLSQKYHREIIDIRRHIHQNPELAFEEDQTAAFVSQKLTEFGIEHKTGIAKTGIVALIKGKNPANYVVGLRADMDALPIHEANTHNFVSKSPGKMHACGHDAHTASLLGTAKILNALKNEFEGTIKLVFQPSEEELPGGASVMIEEGVLENPKVDIMIGQHVYPELPAGAIGMKSGRYMASTDELYLTVEGKGGHGAIPDRNIDPVLIASHIITAMQQVVSRNALPSMPTVVSFGKFIADGQTNIIPDQVHLEGILRTFDESWRQQAQQKIRNIATGIAQSMGGDCSIRIDRGYPVVVNDEKVTEQSRQFAKDFLGAQHVYELDYRMTAEDFAYYSQKVPSTFYRLGVRNEEKKIISSLHSNTFDIDETSLSTSMGAMSWIAINHLLSHSVEQ